MASDRSEKTYAFGDFKIDPARQLLSREPGDTPVNLTGRAFQVLLLLVENHGETLSKRDLMTRVWQDAFVEEGNLTQTISILRKTLGDSPSHHRFIVTESGRGYRFVAPVTELNGAQHAALAGMSAKGVTPKNTYVAALVILAVAASVVVAYYAFSRSREKSVPPTSTQEIKAIAVLPFQSVAADDENKALGIGMADAVIARLSRIGGVAVRQTSSVFRYADATPEAVRIGREINVDAVLEGSIQKAEGRIRVSVRLFRVADGSLVWADTFDEQEADIFSMQDTISQRVASSLALQFNVGDGERLNQRFTPSIEAYHLYNKGRYFWNRRNTVDLMKSIDFYHQAIAKDPDYARAYAGLAESYVLLHIFGESRERESFPLAKEAAEKALALDDELAEAHAALGLYREQYEWNWQESEKEFKQAIACNPNYATGHQWYGEFLAFRGRTDESIAEMEKAVELDPLSLSTNTARAFPFMAARRYGEALEKIKPALELDPNFPQANYYLARSYEGIGEYDKAIEAYIRAINVSGNSSYYISAMIHSQVKSNRLEAARSTFGGLIEMQPKTPVSKYVIARALAALGEKEKALTALEESYAEHDGLLSVIRIDPNFDDLVNEPRFKEVLRKIGF
jgi:TolB-like protein/DNA-binding winged helix-turn-helix (wHTH) protein